MGKYDVRLSSLTQAEIVSRLEGPGGLLALTHRELFYIDDNGTQSARLSQIKRIGVNKQSGTVDVVGEQGTLMSIAPVAFQKDELKLFLESLRGYVLKAKTEPTQTLEQPTAAPKLEEPPKPSHPTPLETPPPTPQIHIAEPPKTLPDEPADSLWAYEGSPRPRKAAAAVEEGQPTPPPTRPDPPPPPTTATPRSPSPTQRLISVLLKVSALLSALTTAGYLVVHMGTTQDIWVPLGVIAVGLSLSLIQWRLSEPY